MTLHTLTIPDDPAELPGWLEQRLMAPDFGEFVAELQAHFPEKLGNTAPRNLFLKWLPVVLNEGFEPVPLDVLRLLLQHPCAILVYQEQIVTEGGSFWDDVAERADDHTGAFERGKQAVDRMLAAEPKKSHGTVRKNAAAEPPKAVPSEVVKQASGRGYKIWSILSTVVAACLAVAVGYLATREPAEPPVPKAQIAWGWGKPNGVAADQSNPKDYLNKLATNVEEWSIHRPSDSVGVGTRIAELRIGCTRLMHSAYGPLAPDDKAWLLENCRQWAKMLDAHQQALDSGADPATVRADVDETIRTIAAALRDKAKQVG